MSRHIDSRMGHRLGLTLIPLVVLVTSCGSGEETRNSSLAGVVRNASGAPVAGALVRGTSPDSGLTFMVVTRDQGFYETPRLLPGKYTVQGFGGGYQSATEGPVEISSSQQARLDLVLGSAREMPPPPAKKMSDSDYQSLMPEGVGRSLLLNRCTACHGPGNFVSRRKNREGWKTSLEKMRFYLEQNPELQKNFNVRAGIEAGPVTDKEAEVMVDYLAKNFGLDKPPLFGPPPTDPNRHLPRDFREGPEAKYLAMELNLGASNPVGAFVVDPQGGVWVSEKTSGILGRLDPDTLEYTRLFTPPAQDSRSLFGTVALDPSGMVWFTSNVIPDSQWFQYDPESQQILNTYDVPVPTTPGGDILFNTLRFHPDGNVWATGTAYHRLVRLDPSTREVTEYPVRYGQHPFGIAIGGDQMIWYAGDNDNVLVRVDPETGSMTPFEIPSPDSGPRRMVSDREGNLWVNTLTEGKIVEVDYRTGEMTEYTPPTTGAGQGIDVDLEQELIWFGEYSAFQIGRLDPGSSTFLEFALPHASVDTRPWMIQLDPSNRNRVWYNSRSGRIGYVELTQ